MSIELEELVVLERKEKATHSFHQMTALSAEISSSYFKKLTRKCHKILLRCQREVMERVGYFLTQGTGGYGGGNYGGSRYGRGGGGGS